MEFRHLQSFTLVAELGSFTRAAESMGVTQAAASQHVAALEKQLGVSLLQRSGRGAVLTSEGQQLYGYARKILDLADEALREVGASQRPVRGTLRIAASTVPAESLLPELLAEFRRLHPQVRESLSVSDSRAATAAVEGGRAEVGFVGELPRSGRLKSRPVAADELVLVVSPGHRLAGQRGTTPGRLRKEPLIVREPGSGSRHCVEQALEGRGLSLSDLTIAMEVNSNDAIRAAVQRGVGVAFLSITAVKREIAEGKLVSVKLRGMRAERQLYVITDPNRVPTAALREFLAFLDKRPTRSNR